MEWRGSPSEYRNAVAAERRIYEHCADVHRLPEIFHYWSNRYLRPKLREYGFESIGEVFERALGGICREGARFVSLGSGNCEFEIAIAARLAAAGKRDFSMTCVDLNPSMLRRGRDAAERAGVIHLMKFTEADLNSWTPCGEFDAVLANQSLHHVVNLEALFGRVRESLTSEGVFLVSDMIGRNGHQRWPEALNAIRQLWTQLPPSYRVNRKFGLYAEAFEDWDCSGEGFEGVRAQDILPLLNERFSFRFFFPYGNLTDVFVDRAFGPNFDPQLECDRAFIDMVHTLDETGFASGRLTPTHLIATMTKSGGPMICRDGLTPAMCIRAENSERQLWDVEPLEAFRDVDPDRELRVFTSRMAEARETIRGRFDWALRKEAELAECTAWALRRDEDCAALQQSFEERSAWAFSLRNELKQSNAALAKLQVEFEQRTQWALTLRDEEAAASAELISLRAELARVSTQRARFFDYFADVKRSLTWPR